MDVKLTLNNVGIGRKSILVDGINSTVQAGDLILLTGNNGSGKSTLLKTIAGLIPTLQGEITLDGTSIKRLNHLQMASYIAFAGTERIRENYVSVEEMVEFGRFPFASRKQAAVDTSMVEQALQVMQIAELRNKYLHELSDGEWQKANIARALAQETPYILLDEPSAFLDYPSRLRLFSDLSRICKEKNKTFIVSTHDVEIANKNATIFWHIESKKMKISKFAPNWTS